ncbi:homocysteine S-methyltransferase [Streptomonospora nanhaiensis]|uniref:S-methylmethionine:homocysteine methyltransferase n=1 Tax=Streptomonospora nanhaiensis TaxID=1323731 RepID=A0A853BFC9_9ACTN|nr:homocysteine S-methyltransferase [Streptomonospora nanhaiensis]MBV2364582.1 homocysteine S-methyltransferase [Streptomonospora nanhaiensis]MBX9387504.1 homocysteine S-methyltransferase [Streptomonospora nanhaiensis]NYI94158.1 homocysteine S-methyltransferase [Streptomonospora nanhaiensis]
MHSLLAERGVLVLDGGLATRLEDLGGDLGGGLWSARLLKDDPALIRRAHRDFFAAGADIAVSAAYQASVPAFTARGLSPAQARALIARSVELARQARDEHGGGLVAAGVGPYGAARADGSEYTGAYDLDEDGLAAWHRERWHLLAESGADLMACETIPSAAEARALARLLDETPHISAWVSFSCRDGERISDGTPLAECAAPLARHPRVLAVGVNCTPPRHIPDLLGRISGVPAVVYPNSGEEWDPRTRRWRGERDPVAFGAAARRWRAAGAALIGGCCRTTPEHIRQIRAHLD